MKIVETIVQCALSHLSRGWSGAVIPFYDSLPFYQKGLLLLGLIPLPVYVLEGQLFSLIDLLAVSVQGETVTLFPLLPILAETFLLLYILFIVFIYASRGEKNRVVGIGTKFTHAHTCLTLRHVPLHLIHDEKKSAYIDQSDLIKEFAGMPVADRVVSDKLPQALEILNNNAAMLDIYERYHGKEEESTDTPIPSSRSLFDILNEEKFPSIHSQEDIEEIINRSN